jgi:hypothetical protein
MTILRGQEETMDNQMRIPIYVVTEDGYEGYYVTGIFANEVDARECSKEHYGGEPEDAEEHIKTWYLNYGPMEKRTYYVARISLDGGVEQADAYPCEIARPSDEDHPEPWVDGMEALAFSWEGKEAALELARKKLAEAKERGARAV